jgi:hypothetical protein
LPKDVTPADIQVLFGPVLAKSNNVEERAGIELIENLGRDGRGDARAEFTITVREGNPVRLCPRCLARSFWRTQLTAA